MPKELQEIFNMKTALCKKCGVPCDDEHLISIHNVEMKDNMELIRIVEDGAISMRRERAKGRSEILRELGNYVKIYINRIKPFID